jgi:hypothetical protein
MKKKIEVTKVVIRIGDKPVELTIDQARELKDALNELLGSKETVYLPSSPVIIDRPYPYPYTPYWTITYGNTGTVTYSASMNS